MQELVKKLDTAAKIMGLEINEAKTKYMTWTEEEFCQGREVWTLKQEEVQTIEIWERKVLRKIFGAKMKGGRWERRTNREIYDLFKEPNIIGIVRAQRMRWIGHVVRMKNHRIPKMVLIHEVGGGKRRGRPRQRWKKAVEDDIRKLNIGNWKEKS
ncbi:hypothetical protein NQ318_018975 [Aromia moschata]|uniref:Endonuclease-reverse transcriptase n=1 Tax=Aromia moschata TaxID=1265417 RepID=A0AAV8Y6P8_9CUCU|nr:hypothetical protein NQ318_018975 [Aromia moschata]